MKTIFTSHDRILVQSMQAFLENAGISCVLGNEQISGIESRFSAEEFQAKVVVLRDDQTAAAELLRDEFLRGSENTSEPYWTCPCGEVLEPSFTDCWKCGSSKY